MSLEAHVRFAFAVRDGRVPQMACLLDASGRYSDVSAYGTPQPVGSRACWITRLPWGDDGLAVWREGMSTSSPAAYLRRIVDRVR